MIAGVGVDIVDVEKVARLAKQHPQRLGRVFTAAEIKAAGIPGVSGARRAQKIKKPQIIKLAAIFAGKEAVLKVLGTGWVSGLNWTDVEVPLGRAGRKALLRGGAKKIARARKISEIQVDVSATLSCAVAHAIGIRSKQ